MSKYIDVSYSEHEKIRDLFMGRKVISVNIDDSSYTTTGTLILDDGRIIEVLPNKGGCSCGSGDYDLTSLERVDNVITRVDFEDPETSEWGDVGGSYTIFVLAGHEKINLLTVAGNDGSGYYGTGYTLRIKANL